MIGIADMEQTARSYLRAARILNRKASSSPDAVAYLCGYAVEIALKTRICRTLGWAGYPQTNAEFQNLSNLKTHNLETLLHLSGRETRLRSDPAMFFEWSAIEKWNPEQRYDPVGRRTAADAKIMIDAAARVLKTLL